MSGKFKPVIFFLLLTTYTFTLGGEFGDVSKADSIYLSFLNSTDTLIAQKFSKEPAGIAEALRISFNAFKKNDFDKIYVTLISFITDPPDDFSYYELLAESVSARNEEKIFIRKIPPHSNPKNNLLLFLLNYKANNLSAAKELFESGNIFGTETEFVQYYAYYVYRGLGNYKKAAEICRKFIDKKSSKFVSAKFLNALSSIYYLSDKLDDAEDFYSKANQFALESGNRIEFIKSLINLGILSDDDGKIDAARKYFERAVKIAGSIHNSYLLALSYSELGTSYTFTGEIIKARRNYIHSYKLFEELKQLTRLSLLADNIGNLFVNIGNYLEAKEYFSDGIQFAGENRRAAALNYVGLGDVFSNLSNYSEAVKYYRTADSISASIGELTISSKAKEGIGLLNFNIGNYSEALSYLESAITLSAEGEDIYSRQQILREKSAALAKLGKIERAKSILNAVVSETEKTGDILLNINSLLDLAELDLLSNNLQRSLLSVKKAEPAIKRHNLKHDLARLNNIYAGIYLKKNNVELAREYLLKAISFSRKINDHNSLTSLYYQLAKITKSPILSEEYYDLAFKELNIILNSLSKTDKMQIDYLSNSYELTENYVSFLLKNKKPEKAFAIFETGKSFNTYHNLLTTKLPEKFLTKYFDINWRLSSGFYEESEVDSLRKIQERLLTELNKFDPFIPVNSDYTAKLKAKLKDDEAYVSFFPAEDFCQIFLITKNNFFTYSVNAGADKIKELISKISPYYDKNISSENIFFNQDLFAFNSKFSNELYQLLLGKAEPELEGIKGLIFSVSGFLSALPFEFLVTDYNNNYGRFRYDKARYLIEKYEIRYALSAKVLLANAPFNDDKGLLVIGDPEFNSENPGITFRGENGSADKLISRTLTFSPLTYSEEEIENISDLFENVQLFKAAEATERNFKENVLDKSVIHISTHAFMNKERPIIVFSPSDNSGGGLLEPGEIAALNIHGNLVVLSACRTALGKIMNGEGIIGMQKVFSEAGAQNIITTLWDINDKNSAKFMELFYSYLSSVKEPSAALQLAKKDFIQNVSSNPYYWAAFVLTGNNNPVFLEVKKFNSALYFSIAFLLLSVSIFGFRLFSKRIFR